MTQTSWAGVLAPPLPTGAQGCGALLAELVKVADLVLPHVLRPRGKRTPACYLGEVACVMDMLHFQASFQPCAHALRHQLHQYHSCFSCPKHPGVTGRWPYCLAAMLAQDVSDYCCHHNSIASQGIHVADIVIDTAHAAELLLPLQSSLVFLARRC